MLSQPPFGGSGSPHFGGSGSSFCYQSKQFQNNNLIKSLNFSSIFEGNLNIYIKKKLTIKKQFCSTLKSTNFDRLVKKLPKRAAPAPLNWLELRYNYFPSDLPELFEATPAGWPEARWCWLPGSWSNWRCVDSRGPPLNRSSQPTDNVANEEQNTITL